MSLRVYYQPCPVTLPPIYFDLCSQYSCLLSCICILFISKLRHHTRKLCKVAFALTIRRHQLVGSKVGFSSSSLCLCPCFACTAGNAPPYGGPPPSYGSQPPPQYPPAPGPQYGAVATGPAPYMSAPVPAPRQSYAPVGGPPQYAAPPGY